MRKNYTSGLEIEEEFGYSRAVAVNGTLYVSATAPVDAELRVLGEDAYSQSLVVYDKVGLVLAEAGFSLADVAHVRIYLAAINQMAEAARAFRERLGLARPALSVVHVAPFSLPDLLLEIELVAVRAEPQI